MEAAINSQAGALVTFNCHDDIPVKTDREAPRPDDAVRLDW